MASSQASRSAARWREVLLGGVAAGVGLPALLKGVRRVLGLRGRDSPVGLGWTAGLLGALVARSLTGRRREQGGERPAQPSGPPDPMGDEAPREDPAPGNPGEEGRPLQARAETSAARRPRRGPSGREHFWDEAWALEAELPSPT